MNIKSSGKLSTAASLSLSNDVEEINTKELAQRISAELKRYSIPQAIFAQRVLCRSQVCHSITGIEVLTISTLQRLHFSGHTFGSFKKSKALVETEVWPRDIQTDGEMVARAGISENVGVATGR